MNKTLTIVYILLTPILCIFAEETTIQFQLTLKQDGKTIPMDWKALNLYMYNLYKKKNDSWKSIYEKYDFMKSREGENHSLYDTLEPGTYRITSKGDYGHPYECDTVFTVSAGEAQKTVEVVHTAREYVRGSITIRIEPGNERLEEVELEIENDIEVGIEEVGADTGVKVITDDTIQMNKKGVVHIRMWKDISELTFKVFGCQYRCGSDNIKTYSKEELEKGIVWVLKEKPLIGWIEVKFRTPEGDVLLTKETWDKYFGDQTLDGLFIYGYNKKYKKKLNGVDIGKLDFKRHGFNYRYLETGKPYMLGEYLNFLHPKKLIIIEGGGKVFEITKAGECIGTVIIDIEPVTPPKEQTFSGRILDAITGQGVRAAHVTVKKDSTTKAYALTDKDGKFVCKIPGGTYQFEVKKTLYYPLICELKVESNTVKTIKINPQPSLKITALYESGKQVVSGEVKLYREDKYIGSEAILHGKAEIKGINPGSYIALLRASEKPVQHAGPEAFIFTEKKVTINEGENAVSMTVTPEIKITGRIQKGNITEKINKPLVMLIRKKWGEVTYLVDLRMYDPEKGKYEFDVPSKGEYIAEAVFPGKGSDKEDDEEIPAVWKPFTGKTYAYFSEPFIIKKENQKVVITLKKDTKHDFSLKTDVK